VIEVERDSVETIRLPEVELDYDMTGLPVQIGLKYGTTTTWTSAAWSAILNNGDGTWTAVATSAEIAFSAANYPQRRYAVLTRVNAKNIERAGILKIV
jgi:hypothetical protein